MKSISLSILEGQYPGAVFLRVKEAARALGMCERTLRNELSRKTFPISTVKLKGKRLIPIVELAKFLDTLHKDATKPIKKGRPRSGSIRNVGGGV